MRAGDDVLALGVEQHVAVECRLAGRGVAGEEHAGRRGRPAVAEDHRLDRHRRAEVVGDALLLPVGPGPIAVPRPEHRLDRQAELGPRVGRDVGDADDRAEARLEPLATRPGERLVPGDAGEAGRRRIVRGRGRGSCPSSRASTRAPRIGRSRAADRRGRRSAARRRLRPSRHPLAQLVVEARPASRSPGSGDRSRS